MIEISDFKIQRFERRDSRNVYPAENYLRLRYDIKGIHWSASILAAPRQGEDSSADTADINLIAKLFEAAAESLRAFPDYTPGYFWEYDTAETIAWAQAGILPSERTPYRLDS